MRLWEVWYREAGSPVNFPVPYDVVLERQVSPSYRLCGVNRPKDHTQIVCTVAGEGVFRWKNTETRLTPGMTFLSQLGDPDTEYRYPADGEKPWDFLWISFDNMLSVRMIQELNERWGYVFRLPLDKGFIPYLLQFRSLNGTTQYVTPVAGAKVVVDSLAVLSDTLEKNEELSRVELLVRETRRFIESNPDRALDIADIAEKLRVSREHLTRVYRRQTGMTPGDFALQVRMKLARRLLRDGLLTCQEIADRTGFSSAGSFARSFRAMHGVSPAAYRRNPLLNKGPAPAV